MNKYTEISMSDAMKKATQEGGGIFMIVPVTLDTTVRQFQEAEGFVIPEMEAKPKENPAKKVIDHGKIVALYTANPPRTVSWIADEIGCSVQTVINHLKKEGIYKGEES